MNILITSGGTREYIDDVRVMTNISTGKLGALIANRLAQTSTVIHYVHAENSAVPSEFLGANLYPVKTAKDALKTIRSVLKRKNIQVVIHAMAVSDFTFKGIGKLKLKSSDPGAFIEYMRQTITPNPKIISHIKEWAPNVYLVGFKFEVGATPQELTKLARESMLKNGCDLVITNDKAEMQRAGSHVARFIFPKNSKYKNFKVLNKQSIADSLVCIIKKI
jgi:phosphopantothenoylcysteine synthetase/decarboxylase